MNFLLTEKPRLVLLNIYSLIYLFIVDHLQKLLSADYMINLPNQWFYFCDLSYDAVSLRLYGTEL